jgi:phage-related protein (TIGR01555 family)
MTASAKCKKVIPVTQKIDTLQRADGWANIYSGANYGGYDTRMASEFKSAGKLTEYDLNQLYGSNGFAKRVIDILVEDITRKWWSIDGDHDGLILKYLKRIKGGYNALTDAIRWALLHGGSICVLGLKDGRDYIDPLDENNIESLDYIHVYDRWRCMWTSQDLYSDYEHPDFGEPEFYTIYPTRSVLPTKTVNTRQIDTLSGFKIHASRVLRFEGAPTALLEKIKNYWWNDSILQGGYERIQGLGEAFESTESILREFIIGVMKMKDLDNKMMSGKEKGIIDRLRILDLGKRTNKTILIDAEKEEFLRLSSTVTGLDTLLDKEIEALSGGCYGIPVSRFMGRSPAGMNSTGDGDEGVYYDKIESMRTYYTYTQFVYLSKLIMLCKKGPYKGTEITDWDVSYPPLKTMDPKQEAEIRRLQSDVDNSYIDRDVLTAGEVAMSRFGGNTYSTETKLTEKRDACGNVNDPNIDSMEEDEIDNSTGNKKKIAKGNAPDRASKENERHTRTASKVRGGDPKLTAEIDRDLEK